MEVRTPIELFYEICYIYWWSPFSAAPFTWLRFVAEKCKIIKYCAVSWTSICVYIIHFIVCLTTGPKPLPKRALHIVRSRASPFRWEYPLLYFNLRSSSSFLRLLPRLPVTSIAPFIFPSISCCRRQFLRKIWPIHETSKWKADWLYIYMCVCVCVCVCYSECFVYVGHSIFAI
jgi:hypothetical protein